jgi:hypothetical protein
MEDKSVCGWQSFEPTLDAVDECRFTFIDKTGTPISTLRFDGVGAFSEGLAAVRPAVSWGYINRTGQIAITPQFSQAFPFSEGLALVYAGGKAGFIDRTGRWVIAPQFQSASSFSDGRALVVEGDNNRQTYRFIDRSGNPAFPETFVAASSFVHGLAHVELESTPAARWFAWINTTGTRVFVYSEGRIP